MQQVGRIPEVGDELMLPGWRLRVVSMDGRRVNRVRFTPAVQGQSMDDVIGGATRAGEAR